MQASGATPRGRGFLWVAAALLATVAAGTMADGPGLRRAGNYLIVVPEGFADSDALTQFRAAKAAQGLTMFTYEVPSGTGRDAIRSEIRTRYMSSGRPDYVLIVGDTSGATSGALTIPHYVGGGSKGATTDLPYACMGLGDDWDPDIAIGRFSVTSEAELQAIVDKTLTVEAGAFSDPEYVLRATFLASSDADSGAEPTHDWVIEHYIEPADYTPIRIWAAQGGGTSDVTAAVNNGTLFMVYFGHSGSSGWWAPSFNQSNIRALSNEGLYGLVFGFSCNTSHFDYDECFGETWIREANKGAAAYISASTFIYYGGSQWESSRRLEKYFFASFFEDEIWEVGPAWQKGLQRLKADPDYGTSDVTRNMFEMFVLLGDPSLLLPQPDGFSLAADPESHDLCSPPDDEAVFLIEVGQLGDFAEPVTLAATGVPDGATVAFSDNSLAPPFVSTLTIGDLIGRDPGVYDIVVAGTTDSQERAINVTLRLADAIPDRVTLTGPADESVGVALKPTLEWTAIEGALSYELEVASDAAFADVVYTATATGTSHTVESPLSTLSRYYWHVRARNACGPSDYSAPFAFTTVNMIMPVGYDMRNGETGSYTYFDDTYDGDGDVSEPLAWLSGGLGDLTDGVIATQHWNQTPQPYVGWVSIDPTITFHFSEPVNIDAVVLHLDGSGGGGGVYPPDDVTVSMGGSTQVFPCSDPPDGVPFAFTCGDLGLSGDTLELTIADYSGSGSYMMLSEVEFFGVPDTGACCVMGECTLLTEPACLDAGGDYQGTGTVCDPNPCVVQESSCLIISEVVSAPLSGGCPKYVEITNTGAHDFTFAEGGVIVQMNDSADVDVDVDLTGLTIRAGEAFVINGNDSGACTGAFAFVYGFSADMDTNEFLGNGNDRYILTDTADGSNLLDIYGEFGVDGRDTPWEYTSGYSYRLPQYNRGSGGDFAIDEWFIGGPDSLSGPNPEELVRELTTPGLHTYDETCEERPGDFNRDGRVDLIDYAAFQLCFELGSLPDECQPGDMDGSGAVDLADYPPFEAVLDGPA